MFGALSSASKLRSITSASHNFHVSAATPLSFQSTRLLSSEALSTDNDGEAPLDEETKYGEIYSFDSNRKYGFIRPDKFETTGGHKLKRDEMIFLHADDVATPDIQGESIRPFLTRRTRVQFKIKEVESDKTKTTMKAYDVTLEGGELIQPFDPKYLERYSKLQKARFGDEIYAIMDTVSDQTELEKSIVEAFERCTSAIEIQEERVRMIKSRYPQNTSE